MVISFVVLPLSPTCLRGKVKVHCSAFCKVSTPTTSTVVVCIQNISTSTQLM